VAVEPPTDSRDVPDDEFVSLLCEGVHAGLRKGSEAPSSGPLWRAISESNDSAWSDAMEWTVWGLKEMGYRLIREVNTEPPFNSHLSVFMELLNESVKLTGCRGELGVAGPGTCCDYHEGFWDGMHALAGRDGSEAT
jgi:hypothetical protein